MTMARAIQDVQDSERDLARQLRLIADRHAVEHDIHHLATVLARQCTARLTQLDAFAAPYGADRAELDPDDAGAEPVMGAVRRRMSEAFGRTPVPAMTMLEDLRDTSLAARRAQLDWIVLGQGAKARRDEPLVATVERCCEQLDTTARWALTRLKASAAQPLAAG